MHDSYQNSTYHHLTSNLIKEWIIMSQRERRVNKGDNQEAYNEVNKEDNKEDEPEKENSR